MSTISLTGTISGLDTSSMLSALISAEQAPLTRLQTQRKSLLATQTAYTDLRTYLARLESATTAFTKDLSGAKRAASSSASTILTASAGTTAIPGSYAVTVNQLATSTRATSTAAMGKAITAPADLGTALSSLSLPGTVTAGSVSMVVDGKVVKATIGSPSTTTLGDALTAISSALTTQIQANEGGSTSTATVSVVNNKLQVAVSGTSHAISFGVTGDTSNALAILGLTGTGTTTVTSTTPMTGRSALGVTSTTATLDKAGLAASFTAASTGTLSINGVGISYDTSVDTLSSLVTKINASTAGVTASLDRTNDKLVLTAKSGGAAYMAITDTGPLAAALNLAPGTTDAQAVGQQAKVTIAGQSYLSDSNKITTAIDGVTITALSEGTSTVTVTADTSGVTTAVKELVNAYNSLADKLDTLTANDPEGTKGVLAGDIEARSLALNLRRSLMTSSGTGTFRSLADLGVTSGAIGSSVGSTSRLSLNSEKLAAAIEQDPTSVATLLNGTSGVLAAAATQVNNWTKTAGHLSTTADSLTSQLSLLSKRETTLQGIIDAKTAALEAKFARMEQTLSQLKSTQNSLTSMNNSSGG